MELIPFKFRLSVVTSFDYLLHKFHQMTFSHYDGVLICSWSGFFSLGLSSEERQNLMYTDQLLSGSNCHHWLAIWAAAGFKGIVHPTRISWEPKKQVLFLPGHMQLNVLQEYLQESTAKQ